MAGIVPLSPCPVNTDRISRSPAASVLVGGGGGRSGLFVRAVTYLSPLPSPPEPKLTRYTFCYVQVWTEKGRGRKCVTRDILAIPSAPAGTLPTAAWLYK